MHTDGLHKVMEAAAGCAAEAVAEVLPAAPVPRRRPRRDTIPLTPHGKVDHRALFAATDIPDGRSEEGEQL